MKKDLEILTISDDNDSSKEERERDEQLKLAQTILQQKIKQFEEESMLSEKNNSDDEVIDSKVTSTSGNKKMTDPDKDDQSINSDTPLSQVNKKIIKKINTKDIQDRITVLGLRPDRADVIIHASEIYLNCMKWAGAKKIIVPQSGLADGMVSQLYDHYKSNNFG